MNKDYSPEEREEIVRILSGIDEQIIADVANFRGLEIDEVLKAIITLIHLHIVSSFSALYQSLLLLSLGSMITV